MSNRVSPQAAAAKAIKAELKDAFPTFKFSVTSESFSGGNAVRIHWIDGPTTGQVKAITDKYQYGSFNGMEDLYEFDNCIDGLPQAKYVTVSRDSSEKTKLEIAAELGLEGKDIKNGYDAERGEYYAALIYREFCQRSFVEAPQEAATAEVAAEQPSAKAAQAVAAEPKRPAESTEVESMTQWQKQKQREEKAKTDCLLSKYWEAAYRAHGGTSMVPERRATDYVLQYAEILEQEMQDVESLGGNTTVFREKFERLFSAWMAAKANCLSPMITGPSRFPTNRANKANRSEDLRYHEFVCFREKFVYRLKKQQRREARAAIDPVADIRAKLQKAEKQQELMKAANKIIRHPGVSIEEKVLGLQTLLNWGEALCRDLLKPDFAGRIGFADYKLTNNLANIKRMRQRLAELESRAAAETKETERPDGIIVTENTEADRLQITFPDIPSAEMRAKLKGRGFKWSPKNGCWQRQLTDNARHALKQILQ